MLLWIEENCDIFFRSKDKIKDLRGTKVHSQGFNEHEPATNANSLYCNVQVKREKLCNTG